MRSSVRRPRIPGRKGSLRRALLAATLATTLLPAASVRADPEIDTSRQFYIQGTIRDPLGRPISGVRIDDGTQVAVTSPDGRYRLAEPAPGTYRLKATSNKTYLALALVTVASPPVAFATVANFTLPYSIGGTWQAGTDSLLLTIWSSAPGPGVPGQTGGASCVYVTDVGTGSTQAATYTGNQDSGGAAVWSAGLPLQTTTVRLQAKDCASATVLTSERSPVLVYLPDATPPVPDAPREWVNTPFPTIGFSASDTGSGVDPDSARVSLDGVPLATGYEKRNYQAQARGLAVGDHVVELSISDRAGNVARAVYRLTVEAAAPALTDPRPTGEVTNASPTIEVTARDDGSGIHPSYIQLVLSNGLVSSHLAASYDSSSGRISYAVPRDLGGVGLGLSPLPDGRYSVTAVVADRAGNLQSLSWSFTVKTLPLP